MNTPSIAKQPLRAALGSSILALAALAMALPGAPAGASPLSWITGERIKGSGNVKKQSRELAHFTGVAMALAGTVEVRIGNSEGVTIETDDNLLPLVETSIENGTLRIRAAKKHVNLETRTLHIVVQAKSIERLSLGGSGTLVADGLRTPSLQLDLGGSGTIDVKNIECDAVSVALGGSGDVKGGGKTRKLSVSIGGSGDVRLDGLKANEASVNIGGSGQATLAAQDSLSVTIAGSGDVNYYGDPKLSQTIVGSGSVKRLGAAR
ncbi:MAG: head GIN domain-containing protein [Pseudomonadota bacterium]